MNTNSEHKWLLPRTKIPRKCLPCYLEVLINFGQIFTFFLGDFIVDFEYYLFFVNATLQHIFVEIQTWVMFVGVATTKTFYLFYFVFINPQIQEK